MQSGPDDQRPADPGSRRPLSGWSKFVLFAVGLVFPAVCFVLAGAGSMFKGEWQSGHLRDKIGYLLRRLGAGR